MDTTSQPDSSSRARSPSPDGPPYVIRIVGLAGYVSGAERLYGGRPGGPTPADGQYLRFYDPGGWSDTIMNGSALTRGVFDTTPDPQDAMHFPSKEAAFRCYQRSIGTRPDGQPNRPLTAFTVIIMPLADALTPGDTR